VGGGEGRQDTMKIKIIRKTRQPLGSEPTDHHLGRCSCAENGMHSVLGAKCGRQNWKYPCRDNFN